MSVERDEPGSVDRPVLVRRLEKYIEGNAAMLSVNRNRVILAAAQESVARMIQAEVGDEVVILYRGVALVPYTGPDGKRHGYEEMVVYDLDAALLGLKIKTDTPTSETNGDVQ